jgi:aminopeptidase N
MRYRHAMLDAVLPVALAAVLAAVADTPGPGIAEALAAERRAAIADLRYELALEVPADRQRRLEGRVVIRFTLREPHRIVLDFAGTRDDVRSVRIGGRDVPAEFADGHIILNAGVTKAGRNEVALEFAAGDAALNRSDEFLYTLFVPARAHLAFPCFDQPDLKARFTLTLTVPETWQAVSNGPEVSRTRAPGSASSAAASPSAVVTFGETARLPLYLFSFAAGRFEVDTALRAGRPLRMFHRETDAAKVARNRDAIFDLHASALDWLQQYTGIPFPFAKFDFVLIPSFQFGGMEHAGAIFYNASGLFLDESATQNQRLGRASLIAHETAHMWFGDLVTMRWFNDVWMKEVFANFMAAKIVNPSFPEVNHDLRFLLAHFPGAYQVDRTEGTNPIRQPLANLADAGQLYGPIIYQKAPIVMRNLERELGETGLRDGLRVYLREFAFANASWSDLIRLLDVMTPTDLAAWSRAWIEERGRPTYTTTIALDAAGLVTAVRFTLTDPLGRGRVWPQKFQVVVGRPGSSESLAADASGPVAELDGVRGRPRPLYVLPSGGGVGYGLFLLDDESRDFLLANVETVPDALTRGAAWITLWDNMLEHRAAPVALVDAAVRALPHETDEQNVQRVLAYLVRAFWKYLPPETRAARGPALESMLRAGIERGRTEGEKAAWFNAYRDTVMSREGLEWLERVWRREVKIAGLTFAEPDEIDLALELAVRDVPGAAAILAGQLARIENPDRKAQFAFVMPALSADAPERERAFDRLADVSNRRREPWVLESLQYLNHPLREAHARRFIGPALALLREIQQTGDIFFPARWMDSTLSGHRSAVAADTVRAFLADSPDYPERLRWTILATADELFRAVAMPER